MAVAEQHSGSAPPALKRQLSYTCSRGAGAPMHDRKLSHSCSFSTAAASPSAASSSSALSSKASCESIPVPDLDSCQLSSSSLCSYESFYQIETAAAEHEPPRGHDGSDSFHDIVPATQPPAVQTMMAAQGQPAAGYDPKRLPSSIFRTQSRCAAEWSATSNELLFSIQLGSHSGEVGDLYYDAAGVFHSLSSVSESGGLCVKGDCATCTSGSGATDRTSVRFAASECVSSRVVSPTLPAAMEEEGGQEAPATEAKELAAAAEGGWCVFGSCWPPMWWPSCACCGCGCGCCRSS